MAVKPGDRVRFLNSVGGGIVKKIDGNIVFVEDEDGFSTPVLAKEIVLVENTKTTSSPVAATISESFDWGNSGNVVKKSIETELPPYEETPEGEKLNIILTFIPNDIKTLSSTGWETYLVNDSNYWLSFIIMSKGSLEERWNLRSSKTIEPGTQLFIEDIEATDLQNFERLKFQCIAFKNDRGFEAKKPFDVEEKIDLTKFFKLHCYKPNEYFDEDCISVVLVRDDKAISGKKEVDLQKLEEGIANKKVSDLRPTVRRIKKKNIENDPLAPLVVDLHIQELVDNTRGMSAADMLNRQIDEFRVVMDAHRKHKGKKIVFIHGKGEGVLRNALLKELNHQYKGNDVQDASFQEYGFGATQVIIR